MNMIAFNAGYKWANEEINKIKIIIYNNIKCLIHRIFMIGIIILVLIAH